MRKIVLTWLALAAALGAGAASVSPDEAMLVADVWAAQNAAFGAGQGATNVVTVCDPDNAAVVLWHQVSLRGGGMLVVAPVTEIEPVVAALDSDPGELPAAHPLRGILVGDMRRRLRFLGLYPSVAASGARAVRRAAPAVTEEARAWGEACEAKWARLAAAARAPALFAAPGASAEEVAVEVRVVKGFEKGGALTHWNQAGDQDGPLYNLYTPNNAVCGCVATACAALAQAYGTTNAVAGLVNAACTYQRKPYAAQTRGGPIDWASLPSNWGGTNAPSQTLTAAQRGLLGRVAYDAGVGASMQWTDGESGARMDGIVAALKDVFGFRHARCVAISDEANPPQEELEKLVYNQCRAGVPVGLGILGHAVVAAGYGLDADGVERVRVFMGWSGSGDGWYALPKIDTKATVGGGTYLSEIVDSVVTMIAYDDDDIVPVAGHVLASGAAMELPDLGRAFAADAAGYFGVRVPAQEGILAVTCQGKEAEVAVGAAAADEAAAVAALCGALPDAFEFALLNCTVAYSLERAKLLAVREGKALLRVSGTLGETNTQAVLDDVYARDQANVNGFTNRFVYYFASAQSAAGDGADLSYGVYLPSAVELDGGWQAKNGALAYGYAATVTTATNLTHDAGHAAETNGLDAAAATNVYVCTFAPIEDAGVAVTNGVEAVDATRAAVLESFARVLGVGDARHAQCTSGISVTVRATSAAAEAAIDAVADPAQACGLHENSYTNGGVYAFTCDALVTNAAAGVVFACAGWSLTNATTGATRAGTGREAVLTLAEQDAVTLTWDFSKTNAVYVTVAPQCANGDLGGCAVAPGSGWYAWGEPVFFSATCAEGYDLSGWVQDRGADARLDLGRYAALLFADAPCTLDVHFRKGASAVEETTNTLTCTATSWCVNGALAFAPADAAWAPTTTVYGVAGATPLASGASEAVAAVAGAVVRMGAPSFVDASGAKWVLWGYVEGALDPAADPVDLLNAAVRASALAATADVAVNWLWIPDLSDPETEFVIEWDAALTTLNAHGYSTNLTTVAELEAHGLTLANVKVTAPKGFKAKLAVDAGGNVVASLELDEDVLRPLAADGRSSPLTILPNADGTVTVKADVANGVRGFWYALYAADDLKGAWTAVATGSVAGAPCVQAQADDAPVAVAIDVAPTEARKFYRLVVTDARP